MNTDAYPNIYDFLKCRNVAICGDIHGDFNLLVNKVCIYCDDLLSDDNFPVSGINALAHYTWLNPDPERIIMVPVKQLREFKSSGVLVCPNEFDGNIIIEAWKYPPVTAIGAKTEWVDRLSLAISLREDEDPRVEGEVERLINETEWKVFVKPDEQS